MGWGCNVHRLPNCCGVVEAGNFTSAGRDRDYLADNPTQLLQHVLDSYKGYPIIFNFKQEIEIEDGNITWEAGQYDHEELRQIVMKHPCAKNLCTFINPNSGNRVDSWMIFEGEVAYEG